MYIDESGQTGQRSKYIVFAVIATENERALEKTIKKVWAAKPQFHHSGELHAHAVDDATRRRVLLSLNAMDITLQYSVIDKSRLRITAEKAYYIELSRLVRIHRNASVIIVDKKDTLRKRQSIIEELGLSTNFDGVQFEMSHKIRQLQAVDFVAWAIGRYYECADNSFKELLKGLKCV